MSYLLISGFVCLLTAPAETPAEKQKTILVEVPAENASAVEDERFLLNEAKRLAEKGALEEALVPLDSYAVQFAAHGTLRYEVLRLDVEVMTQLGRHESALEELERVKLQAPEHNDLLTIRGELRSGARRAKDALPDFDAVLIQDQLEPAVHERALSGKAFALLQLGRVRDAHDTLRTYLQKYPEGRFASLAQKTLRPRLPPYKPRLPDPIPSVQ